MNELQKNGLMMHGQFYWGKIADTSTRAYIEGELLIYNIQSSALILFWVYSFKIVGVKSHNSVSGYLKCIITIKKGNHSSHRFYPCGAFSQPRDLA